MTDARERLSRFSIEPKLGADGKPVVVLPRDLTDLDLAFLLTLKEHRILTAPYIAALTGSTTKWVTDRFGLLKRKPNLYVRVTASQVANQRNHLYSKLFWELAEAGQKALAERLNIKIRARAPVRFLEHATFQGEVSASWLIGFKESKTHALLSWADHLTRDKTPEALKKSGSYYVPVRYRFNGLQVEKDYVPDGAPHGIRRPDGKAMFVCKEIDCDNESGRSDSDANATIKRKGLEQIAILEQELFRTIYGFPNLYFLYYASTDARIAQIMEIVEELTQHKPHLRKNFGFAKHLTYAHRGYDKVIPSGWALTGDYQRIGYEPLNFTK